MESYSVADVDDLYCSTRVADSSGWRSCPCHVSEMDGDYSNEFTKPGAVFGGTFNEVHRDLARELYGLHSVRYSEIHNTGSFPRLNAPPKGLYTGVPPWDLEAELSSDSIGFSDTHWPNLLTHPGRGVRYGGVLLPQFRNGDAGELRQEDVGYARFGIRTGDRQYHPALPNRTRTLESDSGKTSFLPTQPAAHDYLFDTPGGETCLRTHCEPLNWSFHCNPRQSPSGLDDTDCGASSAFVRPTLPPSSQRCEPIAGEDSGCFEDIDRPTVEEYRASPDEDDKYFNPEDHSHYIPGSDRFADTSDFTGISAVRDQSPFADLELSTEEAPSDGFSCRPRSTFSSDHSPPLKYHRRNSQNSSALQWRRIMAMISSLRRQRRRLRQERDLLRRQKTALNLEWRDLLETQRHSAYERDHRFERGFGDYYSEAFRMEYFDKGEWSHYGDNVRTSNGKSEKKSKCDRFSHSDEASTDDEQLSDHMPEPDPYTNPSLPITRPHLPAAAIAEASIVIQSYESAWACLSGSPTHTALKIPYPTSNQQPEGLLARFPSYIDLSPCPVERPSAHGRIKFHALEFYLRPLRIQPQPAMDSDSWSIAGIKQVEEEALKKTKAMMDKEVVRWHDDRLRTKGFGEVVDDRGAVLEIENEPFTDHVCYNEQCQDGQWDKQSWTRVNEKQLVQGVWAAVHLIRESVTKEMEERRRK